MYVNCQVASKLIDVMDFIHLFMLWLELHFLSVLSLTVIISCCSCHYHLIIFSMHKANQVASICIAVQLEDNKRNLWFFFSHWL